MDKELLKGLLMKQVFELGKLFFICLEEDVTSVGNPENKLGTSVYMNGLAIWPLSNSIIEFLDNVMINEKLRIVRYLDSFYLLVPMSNPISRRQLFYRFFSLLGEDYETFIDIDRNKENIRCLLSIINYYLPFLKGVKVVDYGCGTGLSIEIAHIYGVDVIGFDSCPIMLDIANRRGMMVWNEDEMSEQPSNGIDAAFSSYVFHLLPENENLQILFKLLKSGGVLVANFHKDFGREWANQYLTRLGFRLASLPKITLSKRHGSYAVYIKPK